MLHPQKIDILKIVQIFTLIEGCVLLFLEVTLLSIDLLTFSIRICNLAMVHVYSWMGLSGSCFSLMTVKAQFFEFSQYI